MHRVLALCYYGPSDHTMPEGKLSAQGQELTKGNWKIVESETASKVDDYTYFTTNEWTTFKS